TIILPRKRIFLCIHFWVFMRFATPSNLRILKNFTACFLIFIVYHVCIQSDEERGEIKKEILFTIFK
ncbi:hypothetical protein BK702_01085, partial [Bacillus thuringiensis serovar cameroun]